MNTLIEALGNRYPFRVTAYSLRRGSGGSGQHPGGDGLVRELEFLTGTECTLLTERRRIAPYGLKGGAEGKKGKNLLIRNGRTIPLPGKVSMTVQSGDRIRMQTAGGGGFGESRVP